MGKYLLTEESVKKAMNINSFRNLSKDKVMEFVSLIPSMDKELAIAIVNQFPAYAEMAGDMVQCMVKMCDQALDANNESQKDAIEAYKTVLSSLGDLLERENITEEERTSITEKMIEVADKISAKDTENKVFIQNLIKYGSSVLGGALVLGAVILGVNAKGKNIPKIRN